MSTRKAFIEPTLLRGPLPASLDHCGLRMSANAGNLLVGGRSSVAERQLPKLNVVGSIPIARSKKTRHCSE